MLTLQSNQSNWEDYLKYGERLFFKRKSTIFKEGTIGEGGFYYLQKGVVKVYTTTFTGKERTIDIMFSGQVFGEQTVDRHPYFSTARSFEDSVVYFLPYWKLHDLMKKDHALRLLMCDSLRTKLDLLLNNLLIQSLPAEQLMAVYLLRISMQYNNHIPLTQQEISQYTGLTRITIYKIFKKWESDELILVGNKNITINDLKRLEDIAAIP